MSNSQKVKIQILDKRLTDFGLPHYATIGSAALDLRAMFDGGEPLLKINAGEVILIPTGIAIDMPENMASVLFPRSGLGHRNGIVLGNLVGLIDSDYHQQIFISCWNRSKFPFVITLGDRIAQMMFVPIIKPKFDIVEDINENDRGGFGSTGSN
jgi:dUTP pyrophosphatase